MRDEEQDHPLMPIARPDHDKLSFTFSIPFFFFNPLFLPLTISNSSFLFLSHSFHILFYSHPCYFWGCWVAAAAQLPDLPHL